MLPQRVLRRLPSVELDTNQPRCGGCLHDAGKMAHVFSHGLCAALVRRSLDPPKHMAKPVGQAGSKTFRLLPNSRKRERTRVVMDAELCGFALCRFDHVHFLDPSLYAEALDQAVHAGIVCVRYVREQNRYVESELLGHV